MTTLRYQIDATGRIIARRLRDDDAIIAARRIKAQRPIVERHLPDGHRGRGKALLDDLEAQIAHIEVLQDQSDGVVKIEPEPEIAALLEEAVYTSLGGMNLEVDNWVRIIERTIEAASRRPPSDPKHRAAERLNARFFPEGSGYLSAKSDAQWLAVDRRLRKVDAGDREAARLLAVDDVIDRLILYNRHFGRMQGLEGPLEELPEPPDVSTLRREAIEELHTLFARAIAFAYDTWPDDDQADHRRRLVGPYLDKAIERSREGAARRGASSDGDGPTSGDGSDLPTPTPIPPSNEDGPGPAEA